MKIAQLIPGHSQSIRGLFYPFSVLLNPWQDREIFLEPEDLLHLLKAQWVVNCLPSQLGGSSYLDDHGWCGIIAQVNVVITDDKTRCFFAGCAMLWKKIWNLGLGFYSYMIFIDISTTFHSLNGHDSGTDWLEVPTVYKAFNYII